MVRELQLTEKRNNNNNKTNHGKRRRRFLHDGALACGSKVSSVYCTVSLSCRRFLVSVLANVQE